MTTMLEGCIVRMADKIAYAGRDVEDEHWFGSPRIDKVVSFVIM